MRAKLAGWNTLRNQMLFGFLMVMLLILTLVGAVTFHTVSTLLKNNAEKHIRQTAVQANGRLEGMLGQIDTLTTQVATNAYVQKLLLREKGGEPATFAERQALSPIVNLVPIYTSGIKSVELYAGDRRKLYPLDEGRLGDKVSESWIARATAGKGEIVWFGIDPADPGTLIAIRQVSLIDQNFSTGGYLLVRTERKVFAFHQPAGGDGLQETMLLVGEGGKVLASNASGISEEEAAALASADRQTAELGGRTYILVKQRSSVTGWTLLILTPVSAVTEGISVLRMAIVASAGIGTLFFILMSLLLSAVIMRPILRLIKSMRGARFGVPKRTDIVSSTIEINELNHTYNQMVDNINALIRLVYEKEILQSQTELKALQAQIHPHFLFNTLEALYWSLLEKDEEELAGYVVAMSDLFRYTISGPNKEEWVTVRDELEHIEKYLLIMKIRFGDRLAWEIDAPPEFGPVRLPKLLIQPLVENAILHGVESKIGAGVVKIRVGPSEDGEELEVSVEDDGAGMDEETLATLLRDLGSGFVPSQKKSGMGLANVFRRLELFCEAEEQRTDRLSIRSEPGGGTRVRIRIPLMGGSHEGQKDFDRGRRTEIEARAEADAGGLEQRQSANLGLR